MKPATAFIALGSNLQNPREQVLKAMSELGEIPGTRVVARSSLYRTPPVGYTDQPDFVNAAAQIETSLDPVALLQALFAIERSHGRVRDFKNAPRTLDLDLLVYDTITMRGPQLTLPHPRMHERAFVLAPLSEIAPELEIPGHGRVPALLAALEASGIERIS